MNPDREIAFWVRMAFAFERYVAAHPDEDADEVYRDLVKISVGQTEGSIRQEKLRSLIEVVSEADFEDAIRLGS